MFTLPTRGDRTLLEPATWRALPRHVDTVLLAASLAAVLAVRLQLLRSTDFPINDGALFLAFVQALAASFPALPATVDYNGMALPFAYPPLAFWLSAAAVRGGASALGIVHVAPILMNVACVLLFAALLLRTGCSRLFTAVAVLVFGTTFRSYEWLVMGGGLSRGAGCLFLLLVLHALLPAGLWTQRGWHRPRLVLGGLAIGATLLSHLEWGLLAVFCGVAAVLLARPRLADAFRGALVLGVVSAALVVPWFASVVQAHGLAPFEAASRTGSWRWRVFPEAARMLLRNSAQLLPFVLLGAVVAVRRRRLFWLLFAGACTLLVPRSGETPLVLAIGVLAAAGLFAMAQAAARWRWPAAVAVVIAGATLTALRASEGLRGDEHFRPLPQPTRAAMAWVADHHAGARFAIVREAPWYYDAAAEWFPILARAVSVTTAQGQEWLPGARFGATYQALEQLREVRDCAEFFDALQTFPRADFVWVEGVDFRARGAAVGENERRKTASDRVHNVWRRLRGLQPADARRGTQGALSGPGTAAGCLEQARWQEVHANGQLRIFRVPR
ncbi:MAG TPA: hypothetical protein VEA40_17085 [Ramlibacter sp.]|nr:hypothetical protein [Ramlibacter sp.]